MWRRRPGRCPDHPASRLIDTQSGLLVPVREAEPLVGPWRERYALDAMKGVPAHVTVLFPFVPPGDIDDLLLGELGALFAEFASFDFLLSKTNCFPGGVLYLAPEPAQTFRDLTNAVWHRYPEHPPYEGMFEEVTPHLTVADCSAPGLCEEPRSVLDAVERAIVPGVPIRARANEAWLMIGNGQWSLRARFPLRG